MLNIKQAQASSAIQQAFAGNKSAVQVRRPKKDESLFLGEERLDLMVITEKTMQMGQMYATENHYLVLGEEAQKALFNDLKTKTFVPAANQYGEVFIAILNAPSPNGFTCSTMKPPSAIFQSFRRAMVVWSMIRQTNVTVWNQLIFPI